jgi:4-hydroxy-tetrahydrodipicolinate reductase
MIEKPIRILLAGATGRSGKQLISEIIASKDLQLAAAVSRSAAGKDIGQAIGQSPLNIKTVASVAEALNTPSDVLIDYTSHEVVRGNVFTALEAGRHVVIGTSGLNSADYAEIDAAAKAAGCGVIAAGNYSIAATLLRRFALEAAKYLPDIEIIDYAAAQKADVPSGTARELAEMLSECRKPPTSYPIDTLHGPKQTRGAAIGEALPVQVHSLRLPSYHIACEAIFGTSDARLTLRYDAILGGTPSSISYIAGTLLAARKVSQFVGLKRGLDSILDN